MTNLNVKLFRKKQNVSKDEITVVKYSKLYIFSNHTSLISYKAMQKINNAINQSSENYSKELNAIRCLCITKFGRTFNLDCNMF